ncbi:MAG: HD domain-containing protein, partial [Planctomycetota bacterium]
MHASGLGSLLELLELARTGTSPIRLPGEQDVLVTPRIKRILDTPAMQRLRGVSQLGLVSQVYPGATHSRFEHSLGVYRLAVAVLKHLLETDDSFARDINAEQAETFLLAALLHDVGHWPYCHPI